MANPNPPEPAVLYAPIIGFLNLMGEQAQPLLEEDRRALAPRFRASVTSMREYPRCEVLFLYCEIDDDGRVVGATDNLPDLIKACGARLAVLAFAHKIEALKKLSPTKNDWAASTVLTLDRNGDKFVRFFQRLFEAMFNGTTLGMAWVRLAPQVRGSALQDENPGTIMIGGLTHFVFGADWYPCKTGPMVSEVASVSDALLGLLRVEYGGTPDARSLHAPSLYSALGAILGFSVQESIAKGGYVTDALLRYYKTLLLTVTTRDGRTYVIGDLVNMLLFEATQGRVSAWTFIGEAVSRDGSTSPDFRTIVVPIARHVTKTLGTPDFGIPTLPPEHMPREMPLAALKRLWPMARQILEEHRRPPRGWPIDIGWIAADAIDTTPGFPKALAAGIIMEAAIPMSKLRELPS